MATAAALNPVMRPASEVVTIGVRIASSSSRRWASRKANVRGANVPGVAAGVAPLRPPLAPAAMRPELATNPPTGAGSSGTFGLLFYVFIWQASQKPYACAGRSDHTPFLEFTQIHIFPQPPPSVDVRLLKAPMADAVGLWGRCESRVTNNYCNPVCPRPVLLRPSRRPGSCPDLLQPGRVR